MIADRYDELGEENVKAFFPKDYVHTGPEGAEVTAALVVTGLKRLPAKPLEDVWPVLSEKSEG
jgi:hypothetical protein